MGANGRDRLGPVERSEEQVLTGIVSPAGWDSEGRVSSACIATDSGRPYFVQEGDGAEILGYVGRYVSVTGRVSKRSTRYFVRIGSIRPAPHPDE